MIKHIAKYIENESDLEIGGDLLAGWRPPNAPDNCVVILETGGGNTDEDLKDYAEKLIQVLARGESYFTGRDLALKVYKILHTLKGVTLPVIGDGTETYYVNTGAALQTPQFLGQDEKGRFEFSTNYILRLQEKEVEDE